ncbi:hypothetical protein [Massilia pseudoviolaceinigra]|uniref:hypothetical protein n=1 Tax=Massilia pseudoviolaceinigra TaxID=3057165 RepID=UPI0027965C01|nr:hypothetical protein [Massilia sp. CCM 9206]MDQ1921743.1 hypothetical protein [Massilia sp. CCM 9206]
MANIVFNNTRQPAAKPVFSRAGVGAPVAIELLPFTVRPVRTEADLRKAVAVRHAAYARHLPDFARSLEQPEAADYDGDTVILLAESKADGSALGSTRVQTNFRQPLHLETSVDLPLWLSTQRLAEVTRLGIVEGRIGRQVKLALIKACFEHCEQSGVDTAVVSGRAPIDRQYEQLLFTDVFASREPVTLRHVGNLPHRIMYFDIASGQERWEAARHPLLDFFCNTRHPDIDLGRQAPSAWKHGLPRGQQASGAVVVGLAA